MSLLLGRVIGQEKARYRIELESGVQLPAIIRGKLLHEAKDSTELPVVGDIVSCRMSSNELAIIDGVEPRKSLLTRKGAGEKGAQAIASNVDFVLIATSLNQDFNRGRLDRYLTLAWDSGAKPILILTKRDLAPDWETRVTELKAQYPEIPVHAVEAGGDLSELTQFFADGKIAVVVGSSGVGKSTLNNGLIGREVLDTGAIRENDDKGRHTTTSRSMWRALGGWVIDTPGLRELQMLDHEEGLESAFPEVAELLLRCKFGNCVHKTEPGCAIQGALKEGTLATQRWESYQKPELEMSFQKRKQVPAAAAEQRAKWKSINKEQKRARRDRGNN